MAEGYSLKVSKIRLIEVASWRVKEIKKGVETERAMSNKLEIEVEEAENEDKVAESEI